MRCERNYLTAAMATADASSALEAFKLPAFGTPAVDALLLLRLCEGVHEFKFVCHPLLQRYTNLWELVKSDKVLPQFSNSIGELSSSSTATRTGIG